MGAKYVTTPLPEERRHLVTENINLVHYTIQKYFHTKPGQPGYDDLFQSGCEGMVKAAIKYDEGMAAFSTYAVALIIGEVRRYKRDCLTVLRPSSKYRDLAAPVMKCIQAGMEPEETIAKLGITLEDYQEACCVCCVDSLDWKLNEDDPDSATMLDMIGYDQDMEAGLTEETFMEALDELLSRGHVSKVQADVFDDYVSSCLYGDKPTQMELAAKYGISQTHVSRILRAMSKQYQQLLERKGVTV